MQLFGYSEKEMQRACQEAQRIEHQTVLQTLREMLPPTLFPDRWRRGEASFTVKELAQEVRFQLDNLQVNLSRLRADVEYYQRREKAWSDDPLQDRLTRAQTEARQQKERADKAAADVASLQSRLAAEQAGRQVDIAQRDRKIADLQRLLAHQHIALMDISSDPADRDMRA